MFRPDDNKGSAFVSSKKRMEHRKQVFALSDSRKHASLLLIALCCLGVVAKGQQKDIYPNPLFKELTERNARKQLLPWQERSNSSTHTGALADSSRKTVMGRSVYRRQQIKQDVVNTGDTPVPNKRTLNDFCKDTSYTKLLSVDRGQIYVESVDELSGGGMLISALMIDTARLPVPSWRTFMLLLNVDDDGMIRWVKQFEDVTPGKFSNFYMGNVFELPNKEIICSGFWNNDGNSSVYNSVVYRLKSNGDIIWVKAFNSTLMANDGFRDRYNLYITGALIGNDGDILLCGTSSSNAPISKRVTIIRLNSAGDLVWDVSYGPYDGEGTNLFFENGMLIVSGVMRLGVEIPPAISFFTVGYEDGKILSKRFYVPDYLDEWERFSKSFTYWDNDCVRLANGHYLAYGKLFSDFGMQRFPGHYFGVAEFDASFNLVDAYTIYSDVNSNFYNNRLRFDEAGNGLIFILRFINSRKIDEFFGSFYNHQFLNQRKVEYRDIGFTEGNGAAFLKSGGYVSVQGVHKDGNHISWFEWRKMHNSDTSSECLGTDTMLFRFLPLHMKEDPGYINSLQATYGELVPVVPDIVQHDALQAFTEDVCKQTNFCDKIKISGNSFVCGADRAAKFTASKNEECGAIVQWQIDYHVVDSLQTLSDTSVLIWFKNINWNGKLYALSSSGPCLGAVVDSMEIFIAKSQGAVNLGPDTSLCPGNHIILNAGAGYSNYEWQDLSTDSVFVVKLPGAYFVKAKDHCGISYTDTVLVSAAPAVPFDVGSDIKMCSNESVTITAPSGFLNYSWSPDQSISSTTGRSAVISPLTNTTYFVTAEKTPGCFAYDTLHVAVYSVPAINLGNDTSFCEGGMMTLAAGTGFSQTIWSNGETEERISVNKAGVYSVTGITAEGCKSSDTLRIAVWPKPSVELGTDSTLCAGGSRILVAGNHASYLWQDGSTAPTFTVHDKGRYYVQVTDDHHCSATDIIDINTVLLPPSGFLKPVDSLCIYEQLRLSPRNNYQSYLWSTGAASASIPVTTPGTYILQVTDSKGCTGWDTTTVVLKECLEGFFIPSAFTPNNDKLNDFIKPVIGAVVKEYHFVVYNRWGQVVFSTKDIHKGWDGSYKGVPQDAGLFMWTCAWQTEGDIPKMNKGTLTLIR